MAHNKKQNKKKKIIILTAIGLVVVLLAGLLTYTLIKKKRDSIVMTSGELEIDNVMFNYFLWSYVNEYHGEESEGPKPDLSLTLDVQMYDQQNTWEEYLEVRMVEVIEEVMALYLTAEAEGFTMPEDVQKQYDETLENFKQISKDMKYEDFDHYLVDLFGEGSTEETFKQFLYYDYLSDAYATELYERTIPTQEQVQAYHENWSSQYEETDMETARANLHEQEFNNLIEKAKAEHPFVVHEERIVVSKPVGVEIQTEETGHEGHNH